MENRYCFFPHSSLCSASQETKKRKHQDKELAEESEVSTELALSFREYWCKIKKPRTSKIMSSTAGINTFNVDLTLAIEMISRKSIRLFGETIIIQDTTIDQDSSSFGSKSNEETSQAAEAEGRTEDSELNNINGDIWKIKKTLRESDVGNNLCRLLVPSNLVNDYILAFLTDDEVKAVESNNGARIVVWDLDTDTQHELVLKRWPSTKSYVFIEKWNQEFVNRRNLKAGDEIGLFWDPQYSRINFAVLNQDAPASSDDDDSKNLVERANCGKSKKPRSNSAGKKKTKSSLGFY